MGATSRVHALYMLASALSTLHVVPRMHSAHRRHAPWSFLPPSSGAQDCPIALTCGFDHLACHAIPTVTIAALHAAPADIVSSPHAPPTPLLLAQATPSAKHCARVATAAYAHASPFSACECHHLYTAATRQAMPGRTHASPHAKA